MGVCIIWINMSSKRSPQFAQSAQSTQSTQSAQSATKFEEELGELVRRAEAEGVDLLRARDVEASEEGYRYMIEISRVRDS